MKTMIKKKKKVLSDRDMLHALYFPAFWNFTLFQHHHIPCTCSCHIHSDRTLRPHTTRVLWWLPQPNWGYRGLYRPDYQSQTAHPWSLHVHAPGPVRFWHRENLPPRSDDGPYSLHCTSFSHRAAKWGCCFLLLCRGHRCSLLFPPHHPLITEDGG